ncbi:microtubule-associated serine/threonine-protein kinase 3-like [Haemaphysalis longicornis]
MPAVAVEDKKRSAVKVVTTMFPRIPKVTMLLLEFFIRREGKIQLTREPLAYFCSEEVVLAAEDMLEKLNRQVITFQDVRETTENLIGLHNFAFKRAEHTAKEVGESIRKLTIIMGELATSLEKVSEVAPTDWMNVGDIIIAKTCNLNIAETEPFWKYIPRTKDFTAIKLLGAGGFGSVYKAAYNPTNFTCTIKLVPCDRFQRHKQACMDKVVASVIKSPFLVKYYACYSTRDAYVTMMEFVFGVDLMRVLDKVVYLPTEECRIVMAQLILATEHLHLRGFLHRDIKASNMLIIPGGRVKVIDFDTNKVCVGHFSKRICKGYFSKTAFEFHDGESAGTVPYMSPEILKRRPYGRACDWWSVGVTFYKVMTGRVPFRGENKHVLKDKIINQPLKWPNVSEHPNSATPEAKHMVYRLLMKNPIDRLGSKTYGEIRNHPFFENFDWKKLSSSKDLCHIPAIAECMTRKEEEKEHLTVSATSNARKRKLLKLEKMVDVEASTQRPLYTFSSPGFKKMISHVKKGGSAVGPKESFFNTNSMESDGLDYGSPPDVDMNVGITCGTGSSADKSILAMERMDVILFRAKALGKFWSFGLTITEVTGENNKKFFVVDKVKSGTPAEASHVLEGDVIVAVNGKDIAGKPIAEVQRMMQGSSDSLVLTVLSSSAFRLLECRRDMDLVLRAAGRDTLRLRALKAACAGSGKYGFKTFGAKAWNNERRLFQYWHVVQQVGDVHIVTPNKKLFPGDMLVVVDGVPVDNMDQKDVRAALANGGDEINITIAPMSPLRMRRPSFTRLHETVMTDANLPEPSGNAQIQAAAL